MSSNQADSPDSPAEPTLTTTYYGLWLCPLGSSHSHLNTRPLVQLKDTLRENISTKSYLIILILYDNIPDRRDQIFHVSYMQDLRITTVILIILILYQRTKNQSPVRWTIIVLNLYGMKNTYRFARFQPIEGMMNALCFKEMKPADPFLIQ